MMSSMTRLLAASTALTAAALFTAAAQTPAPAPADSPAPAVEEGTGEEEVVVTARRREEVAQRTPATFSSFGERQFENKRLENINDVAKFVPGFQFNPAFGSTGNRPVIRGASNILIAEGKVGVFYDGIPILGNFGQIDVANLRRLEVIRGPQSALYGRGTLSGAINYVTQTPSDVTEGKAELTFGNYDRLGFVGSVSGPIVEGSLGFYLGVRYDKFGGDYTNFVDGSSLNGYERSGVNFALTWTPTEWLSVTGRVMYDVDDEDHYAIYLQDHTRNNCFLATRGYFCGEVDSPERIGLNTNRLLSPGTDREALRTFLKAEADLGGGWSLIYAGGYSSIQTLSGVDQTYNEALWALFPCSVATPNNDCSRSAFETTDGRDRSAYSNELRLQSPQESRVRGSIGIFALSDKVEDDGRGLERNNAGPRSLAATNEVDNVAIFGNLDFDLMEGLTVSLEGRWARDEITNTPRVYRVGDVFQTAVGATGGPLSPDVCVSAVANGAITVAGTPVRCELNLVTNPIRMAEYEKFTPRVTVSYQANDNVLIYATYGEGNSPGGFNPVDSPSPTFEEEKLTNYELGVKTSWANKTILNATAFLIEYENQGLTNTYISSTGVLSSFVANIGKSEIKGLELEASSEVMEGLTLSGNYALLDAEIVAGVDRDQAILRAGAACNNLASTVAAGVTLADGTVTSAATPCTVIGSLVGKEPPLVSRHKLSLSLDYVRPMDSWGGDIFFNANLTYRSSFFDQVHNLAKSPASTKVDFQLGWENETFRVAAWVKNAFDDRAAEGILRYINQLGPNAPGGIGRVRAFGVTPGAKRTFGLTATMRF